MFRCRSHVNYTFHEPVPADFDRSTVLGPEDMRALGELQAKIKWQKRQIEIKENEKKFICQDILEFIVYKAGEELFNTPRPTVVPTDSFNEDFDIDFIKKQEQDLKLDDIGTINKMLRTEGSLHESSKNTRGSKNSKYRNIKSKNNRNKSKLEKGKKGSKNQNKIKFENQLSRGETTMTAAEMISSDNMSSS